MGRKWYVVTVGKGSIGVFPTWIEAGPLVKGVPEAIYQGFPSEAEARRVFAEAMAKGTTKVLCDDGLPARQTPRQVTNAMPNHISQGGSFNCHQEPTRHSHSNTSVRNTPSRTAVSRSLFAANQVATPLSRSASEPAYHFDLTHHSHSDNGVRNTGSQTLVSHSSFAANQVTTPVSRSASEPAYNFDLTRHSHSDNGVQNATVSRSASGPASNLDLSRRIEELFKKDLPVVEVQAQVSPRHARALTPTELSSPKMYRSQPPESVVVETPTWLTSYPKARQNQSRPLSPLRNGDLPLSSFASLSMEPSRAAASTAQSPASSPSVGASSSIYLAASPTRIGHVVYQTDRDPRSPIKDITQVPELAYVHSMSFSTPSPLWGGTELPGQYTANGTPKSSLLFKSSPRGSGMSVVSSSS